MFTSEQIEEAIAKVKKLRDARDIDISELKNPTDLRKAYLIRKIVSEELKKINPEIKDSTINKFANREIRERIINNYIEKKSTLDNNKKEKDVWEYYSRDVYDMITLWPWLTVSKEFYYFSQNNEMIEQAELDQFLRLKYLEERYGVRLDERYS
jgi:hypothetical protein